MAHLPRSAKGRTTEPGLPEPLGVELGDGGANFAVYSKHATEVRLLLFDRADGAPAEEIPLKERTGHVHHAFLPGIRAGQLYGYRVFGDFVPGRGLRFNGNKLLADPYAKALTGKFVNEANLLLAYDAGSGLRDLSLDPRDNFRTAPKSIVVDDSFDWQGVSPPRVPRDRIVVYEAHPKGFTAHRSSGVSAPGTWLGFIEKIPHLKSLGVTAVELLPVQEHYTEDFLRQKGLANYWGYNTIGFFAPESSYGSGRAPGCQVDEFKTLVRELHRAGIEVFLDVVYNHTGEGNELGPTLSFKGIDNPSYYCLTGQGAEPGRYYMNYTGCGNSLDFGSPPVIRLVMDSLRYWVETMHVDGFRFDLATVLGRDGGPFKDSAAFFDAVAQDPVLARVRLIAEPWDLGTYQVGNFPVEWSEWNGKFRDTVRRFGKGDDGQIRDLGFRVTGSSDLFQDDGRDTCSSVNFVTCHDGFTLWDLVSYDGKHNEANLEGNRDGTDDNDSWNCGAEGETDDPAVLSLRHRIAKNHVCALLFSLGTPMLLGGDEFLNSQRGNNNAYCQDNEIGWFDWKRSERSGPFAEFVRKAIAFRMRHPVLRRSRFRLGKDLDADHIPDISWFAPDPASPPRWEDPGARTLCWRLDAKEGAPEERYPFLYFILNGDWREVEVGLPPSSEGMAWHRVVDTSLENGDDFLEMGKEALLPDPGRYRAAPRSTVVLAGRPVGA
jgi:glycogen operon protein